MRVILNIEDDINVIDAIKCVETVISSGRISSYGKSYCCCTTFHNGLVVYANLTKTGNDIFRVQKTSMTLN